jgi:hypothetical protein
MLRGAVLVIAAAVLAGGSVALVTGAFSPAFFLGLWGALIVIGTLYERVRYKPLLEQPPGPDWEKTPERFLDPETGKPVTVYVEPGSGARQYVQE